MFESTKHQQLITLSPELDLSPKNKKKFEEWKKAFAKNPKKCETIRFVPSRKQFYEGGVRGILWPGKTVHNTVNGIPDVTPSDPYEITKDGYCPQSEPECLRLLLLSQDSQNRICLYEDRELGSEAKTSEIKLQQALDREAKHLEEIEELRRKLNEKGGR